MAAILADDILEHIFLNENVSIFIKILLKFVPNGSIHNKSALVQVMAWRRTGDKPSPEVMITQFTDAYMRHYGGELNDANHHTDIAGRSINLTSQTLDYGLWGYRFP